MGSKPLIRNPKVPGRKDWRDSYAFDSQNVAFWYQPERQYVCYHRRWVSPHGYHRTVYRSTSKDFVNWTESKIMEPTFKGEELYTNTMSPYFRAPHILIGLPTEIFPKRKNSTHILFLTSRGGTTWDRTFREAFIRPGLSENNKWGDRVNYAALNIVPMSDTEMSIYVRDRRYKLRTDGFVSIHAGFKPGALITKPLMFKGDSLFVNYSTSAGGSMRVEIQTPDGKPIKGFEPSNGTRMIGDQIRRRVSWRGNPSLKPLEGKPVRLKFSMKDADLYSMQFQEEVSP
jgi:hypothetical protein